MLFKKKDNLVGLDIGSKTLKVAELSKVDDGYRLVKFGIKNIATGLIEEDGIKDSNAVAQSIKELYKETNIKESNVAISVGGFSVIVKTITVNKMSDNELQENIAHEAEQYIPFDINDVNLDYQIINEDKHGSDQIEDENSRGSDQDNVLLVAAKKDLIKDYLNVLEIAELNPCIIDVDAFALQNIYEVNYEPKNESIALINIGYKKTSLNIVKNKMSLFMRDVSFGCSQIDDGITAKIKCSADEAEKIRCGKIKSDKLSIKQVKAITMPVIDGWATEIRRALDFFYSTYPDEQIETIMISGGGANISGFKKILAEQTSAEIFILNPFEKIDLESISLDKSFINKNAPQAAICMGLAIRKVGDK